MPINKHKLAAFDVETAGQLTEYALQPFRLTKGQAWINSSAVARFDGPDAKQITTRSIREPDIAKHRDMLVWAADHDITLVGWNMAFDVAWLIAQGLEEPVSKCKFLDAMLLWQHLEREPEYEIPGAKKRPWSLKQAVLEFWPKYAGYEAGIDYNPQTTIEWARLLKYNELDVAFTLKLAVIFYNRLESQSPQQLRNALIEAKAIVPVAQSIVQGLVVNTEAAHDLRNMLDAEIEKIRIELAVTGVTETIMASPKQLQELLYSQWRLPVLWKTPKGAPSTDKTALYLLAEHDARVSRIKTFREHKLNRTKFCDKILESELYNEDGRTRPAMRIYGTYTGRATFGSNQGKGVKAVQTGFAIHQMKNGPEYRGLITVPEGYTLVEWDASGQEYRWMAVESGDDTMLSLCQPGEDPHSYMGASIIHEPYEWVTGHKDDDPVAKQGRKMGKMGNLSCVAASTEVLTSNGVKAIIHVGPEDLVWDGVEFVSHDGVVFNGYREVITYQGLTATPDHQVLCGGEWVSFGRAAERGWTIDTAGWGLDDHRGPHGGHRRDDQDTVPLQVQSRGFGGRAVPDQRGQQWVPHLQREEDSRQPRPLHSAHRGRSADTETCQRHASPMLASETPVIPQLRCERGGVPVRVGEGGHRVHQEEPTARYVSRSGYRPQGQYGPLRAREPEIGNAQHKPAQHETKYASVVARPGDRVDRLDGEPLLNAGGGEVCAEGPDWRTDSRAGMEGCEGETQGVARHREAIAVYDILNCGSRNRFVANGLIVHNCQFRIGYKKLHIQAHVQFGIPISLTEADHIHRTYHGTYPGVKQYWKRKIAEARRKGYAETIAGRRVLLNGSWTDRSTGWKLESTAVNFPIQGVGADQKYLAIAAIQPMLRRYGGYFYFELHDGLYAILPDAVAMKAGLKIRDVLSNLPYKKAWGFTPPIPMPFDMKIGKDWGSLREIKA